MTFEEDGVVFSRQHWDVETHNDLFHVDKLPLVDANSRLGELLLASAHRPPAGPCRTRSHTKYHLRSCRVAALLTGPLEKRITSLMSNCVPCKKRKIGLREGELTQYSPHMKSDRFKISHLLQHPRADTGVTQHLRNWDKESCQICTPSFSRLCLHRWIGRMSVYTNPLF